MIDLFRKIILITGVAFAMPVISFSQNWVGVGGGVNNNVLSICADTVNNRLYIAGQFSDPSCTSGACYSFAYWDNVAWHYIGDSTKYYNNVPLAYYRGKMYTANIQGSVANTYPYIGELNGNAWVATDAIGGVVTKLKVINDRLYAVGGFYNIGGTTACNVAYKDSLGWHALDTTTWSYNYGFQDVAEYNGSIYVCGKFFSYDQTIRRLAKWDGTHWSNVGGTMFYGSWDGPVSLCTYKNELYAGGGLDWGYGDIGNGIMKWNDTAWSQLGVGLVDSFANAGVVVDMKIVNNKLIMSGAFSFADNVVPACSIVEWDGTRFCGFGGRFRLNSDISCFANYNNQIYIAGPTYVDTVSLNYIGRWVGGSYRDSCGAAINSINKYQTNNNIFVYPNPAANEISLSIENISNYQNSIITIQNTLGQTVKKLSFTKNIDVSDLPQGCYFLQITLSNKEIYKAKFIKQ